MTSLFLSLLLSDAWNSDVINFRFVDNWQLPYERKVVVYYGVGIFDTVPYTAPMVHHWFKLHRGQSRWVVSANHNARWSDACRPSKRTIVHISHLVHPSNAEMRSVHLVKEAAKKAGAKYYGRNMESNQRRLNIYLSQRFVQYNFCSMDQSSTEGVRQKPRSRMSSVLFKKTPRSMRFKFSQLEAA